MGLGAAYAGTRRQDLLELLVPLVTEGTVERQAQAALALGMVFVGALEEDALSAVIETVMYLEDAGQTVTRYFAVALGLLCLG